MDTADARVLWVTDLGLRPYDEVWSLQRKLVFLRQAQAIPDLLLTLEHEPVITLGKGAQANHILVAPEELARKGVALRRVDRGGEVTFHGPGQIVAYPILDLSAHGKDAHLYCRQLEEVGLRILAEYGLKGQRVPGFTGVWVGEEKIMAIGVGVKRWISFHGLALNIHTDLSYFRLMHPCGIRDRGVTSLARLLPRPVPLGEVKERLLRHFCAIFRMAMEEVSWAEIKRAIDGERKEAVLAGAEGSAP